MEVAPQVGPTGGLAQTGCAIGVRLIKLGIALVAVRLQDATGLGQMAEDMLFLPVWREPVDGTRWRCPHPRALIAHIGPDPALPDTFAKSLVSHTAIQHPDRCVICVQQVAGHDVRLDPFDQRRQGLHGPAAPADKGAFGNVSPHAFEDFVLAIQRQVIVKFGDQHMRQQVRPRHAARDRTAGSRLLHHPLAATAGFLDPGNLDHLHLGGDHVQQFADILAHHAQVAAAVRAAGTGIKFAALARRHVRDTWAAAQSRRTSSFR
ncbi:hypothetical protein RA2_04514 [Roseovarius sp. A-2]|nr:hypothetical protein RA2_04514 [Roseovarius sp. A-2]